MIRSAIWLAAAALIVGAAFHAFTPKASACSCLSLTPEEELEQADAVFLGELVSIRRIGQFPRDSSNLFTQLLDVLEFKASEIWKGHPYETIYVHTYPRDWHVSSFGTCHSGYLFLRGEGERFVVFVSDDSVSLSLCGSSEHESQALNYFVAYGKGRSPEPGSVGPMPPLPPDVFALPAENSTEPEAVDTMPPLPAEIPEPPAENSTEPEAIDTMPSPPSDISEPPAENSTEPEAIDTMPPPDISEPPVENSPASAGRCGLPLHSVSNYGDAAALIMIVGLPGLARLISRRRTRKSNRDA